MYKQLLFPSRKHLLLSIGVLLLLLLSAVALSKSLSHTTFAHAQQGTGPISPFIWGENLTLQKGNDFFLSQQADATIQQLGIQIIRFPDRGNIALTTAAAQKIKALNLAPLLILHFQDLAGNTALLRMMTTVFGTETVYYEYGNEQDLPQNGGVSAPHYTAAWNAEIPQLKALAPTAKFIGPVNFQANPAYIAYFIAHATPLPDYVSWHEYSCNAATQDAQTCIAHIANWTTHITQTRQAMINAIGRDIPEMITEYNWASTPSSTDLRDQDTTFLQTWQNQAINTLIQNQVAGAMHYTFSDNNALALVSDSTHTLTGAGNAFQTSFHQAMTDLTSTPTVLPPTVQTQQSLCLAAYASSTASTPSGYACLPYTPSTQASPITDTLCFSSPPPIADTTTFPPLSSTPTPDTRMCFSVVAPSLFAPTPTPLPTPSPLVVPTPVGAP